MESTTLSWFESYLADRTQSFTHAGRETCSFSVDCSVPQGSVLGPRCFVSYTEDVVSLLDRRAVRSHFYADDTQFHDSTWRHPLSTPGLRVGSKGARHSMSSPTALAACPLAHPVQTVLPYAFSFQRKLPGVAYLSDIVQTVRASRPRLRLRSSSSTDYVLPRLRTKFGERAFSHAGPSEWNRLPEDIRAEPDVINFRKLLKTHYFNSVFNVQNCIVSFYL